MGISEGREDHRVTARIVRDEGSHPSPESHVPLGVVTDNDNDGLASDGYNITHVRWHFPVTSDAENLVIYLLAICVSSWAKDMVRSNKQNIQTSGLTDTDNRRVVIRGKGDWGQDKESRVKGVKYTVVEGD